MIFPTDRNRPRSEVFFLTETKHATAAFSRHSRPAVLALLALTVAVAATPLILAVDAAWVVGWSDGCAMLIVATAAVKCLATTRRLRGQERTAWLFISLAYVSYALAQ